MRDQFIEKEFIASHVAIINKANEVLARYAAQGYELTLRQLYYQFVSVNFFPNSERSYKLLGNVISDARLAGYIDWDMIRDLARSRQQNTHWRDPAHILDAAAASFQINKWERQRWHVELLVEKQALEGVLLPVCQRLDIGFMANKGYSSSSAMYEMGQRLMDLREYEDKRVLVLYLGDHDPSGMDMTRDVEERLTQFSRGEILVQRLALNMDQIEELQPPENPAKVTDSRANSYIARYGQSSWELDAVEPRAMDRMVTDAVLAVRNEDLWEEALEEEQEMRSQLKAYADQWRNGGAQ